MLIQYSLVCEYPTNSNIWNMLTSTFDDSIMARRGNDWLEQLAPSGINAFYHQTLKESNQPKQNTLWIPTKVLSVAYPNIIR